MLLRLHDVAVTLDDTVAVRGIDLELAGGEVLALLGPSGSGKTTLLRAVAGLEALTHGTIEFGGRDLAGVPPHRRDFAMMFQDHALFPHRDVGANVEFGLRMRGIAGDERARRVQEILHLVGLVGFEHRAIATLSGGEQQRVALARALAPSPELLLLDEPLGALDRLLRDQLADDLGRLIRDAALATIVVTHDHDEAFRLADRIAVMLDGTIAQVDAPAELWRHPTSEWLARFLGHGPATDGVVSGSEVSTPWGVLPVVTGTARGPARVVLRSDALSVDGGATLRGQVVATTFRGASTIAQVQVGGGPLGRVIVEPGTVVGSEVRLRVDPEAVLVYPVSTSLDEVVPGSPPGVANDQ